MIARQLRAFSALAVTAALAAVITGCHKDKDSLLVVKLTADAQASSLTTLKVEVARVGTKTYQLKTGLSDTTPYSVGFYVPASVTGDVAVTATATGSEPCAGYTGTGTATVKGAGSTEEVDLVLHSANTCPADGGAGAGGASGGAGGASGGTGGAAGGSAGGSGGRAGSGGSAGSTGGTAGVTTDGPPRDGGMDAPTDGATEGPPQVVDPPSLSKCTEYMHNAAGSPMCNDMTGISDWSIGAVAFTPDGKVLLSAGQDGRVKVWNVTGGTLTDGQRALATDGQGYLAFSPDGKLLAVGSRSGIDLYNYPGWGLSGNISTGTSYVYGVAFTPDGLQLAAITDDKSLLRFTVATKAAMPAMTLPSTPYALAISPVATATAVWAAVGFSDGSVSMLNIKSATVPAPTNFQVTTIDPASSFRNAVEDAQFSPDGKLLAVAGEDSLVRFYAVPLASATPPAIAPNIGPFLVMGNSVYARSVSFSPSGRHIAVAVGSDGGYGSIWDAATHALRGRNSPTWYTVSAAFSPSGGAVAFGEVACGIVALCAD